MPFHVAKLTSRPKVLQRQHMSKAWAPLAMIAVRWSLLLCSRSPPPHFPAYLAKHRVDRRLMHASPATKQAFCGSWQRRPPPTVCNCRCGCSLIPPAAAVTARR